MDINTLVHLSKQLRFVLNQKNTEDDSQVAMEIMTNVLIIETLRSNSKYKTKAGGVAYVKAKKRLIEIMETTSL